MDRDALAQAIIDLENGAATPIADPLVAYELGQYVKPLIDQLSRRHLEDDAFEMAAETDAAELEDRAIRRRRATRKVPRLDGPAPELEELSAQDKARWILMERFIPLERHEAILDCKFSSEEFDSHLRLLDRFLEKLFLLPDVASALEACDLPALQKLFASTLLIFRHPTLGDPQEGRVPCTIENLRHAFPAYFYKRRKTPNWYESQPFYTAPIEYPHWVLCGLDYLNCTLRRPERRLQGYARHWSLPEESVRQKTALEDIYDRIVCGEALEEQLFEQNCSACTSTYYRARGKGPLRMVYIVQRRQKIAIHGRVGLPHWRANRRLWPGVFPAIIP